MEECNIGMSGKYKIKTLMSPYALKYKEPKSTTSKIILKMRLQAEVNKQKTFWFSFLSNLILKMIL
jgi:hypothetical protein